VHPPYLTPTWSRFSSGSGSARDAFTTSRCVRGTFTSSGFTLPGQGFIHYSDITAAKWISSEPFPARARRKQEDFDHIEFALRNGSSVTLTDVEQAVFPLLHFFKWMIERRKHAG
jgi:hypothetical protein